MYIAYDQHGQEIERHEDVATLTGLARLAVEQGRAAWVDIRKEGCAPPREGIGTPLEWTGDRGYRAMLAGVFRHRQFDSVLAPNRRWGKR